MIKAFFISIVILSVFGSKMALAQTGRGCQIQSSVGADGTLSSSTYAKDVIFTIPVTQLSQGEWAGGNAPSKEYWANFTMYCAGPSYIHKFELISNQNKLTTVLDPISPVVRAAVDAMIKGNGSAYQGGRWNGSLQKNFVTGARSSSGGLSFSTELNQIPTFGLNISVKPSAVVSVLYTDIMNREQFEVARLTSSFKRKDWPYTMEVVSIQKFWLEFYLDPILDPCLVAPPLIIETPDDTVRFDHMFVTDKLKTKDFNISLSRDTKNSDCKRAIQPSITFKPMSELLNNQSIDLKNGFTLSLKDLNTNKYIIYNESYDTKKMEGDQLTLGYRAEVKRNEQQAVKTGSYSTVIRYIVEFR